MWVENQNGDLLNADRYSKFTREECGPNLFDITAYESGANEIWDTVAAPLTTGESKALMARLMRALVAGATYFDTAAELEEVRAEITRLEKDHHEAEGEAHGTQH